jgi:hypothetical protein
MATFIKIWGVAGDFPGARIAEQGSKDKYLKTCDFEAYEGRGSCTFTDNIEDAMMFISKAEAMLFWKTQSKIRPKRPDGKPNRPLTAYHVEIFEV